MKYRYMILDLWARFWKDILDISRKNGGKRKGRKSKGQVKHRSH